MKTLETLAKRGLSLNGTDYEGGLYLNPNATKRVPLDKANRDYLVTLAASITDLAPTEGDSDQLKADKAKMLDVVRNAMAGDRDALRSLNALRLTQTDNFIKATSNFMSVFEIVSLKDNEEPGVENNSMNEIACGYVAQDGTPKRRKIEPLEAHARIPLRYITSDRVGYFTQDIYKGNIKALAEKTFDIAFDLAFRIDRECYNLLTASLANGGAYGTFTFTGAKASRVYVPHSGIVTAHLPTTNDITVRENAISADGTQYNTGAVVGRIGKRVIQEIIRYSDSWGNVFPSGRLVPTGEIVVPSSDIFAVLADLIVSSTSQSRPNETDLEREVRENGYTELTIAGKRWKFIPDVTIATGTCYPKFNKVPGQIFLKPGLDKEFTFPDVEKNWEERSQQKVWGGYILSQWRMNSARFTYK